MRFGGLWVLALVGLASASSGCARWGFDPPADGGQDANLDGGLDGGDLDGGSPDGGCRSDADCDPGTCQAGICRRAAAGQACVSDSACEPPGVCSAGWCLDPCARDADCATGHCDQGHCSDAPTDPCRKFVRLRDDFEDELLGDAWDSWTSGGAVLGEAGGRLALSASAAGSSEAGLRSKRLFDLTASQVTIEVATMVNTGQQVGFMFFLDHPLPSNDRLLFKQWAGTLSGQYSLAGNNTFVFQRPWDPIAHRFLRISEDAGYAVWSASADGLNFEELHREPAPIPMQDLRLNLQTMTLGATSAPGAVRLEQVNGTRLPPSGGELEVCPVSTVQDDFDDSLLRPLWNYAWAQAGTSYQVGGGYVTLSPAVDQTGYAGLLTGDPFDLREGAIWATLVQATADDPSTDTEFGVMRDGGADLVKFSKTGSDLLFWTIVAGTQTGHDSLAYDPVAHRHWRLRHATGFIHWETSPDASTWTEQAQVTPPFDLGEVQLFMQAGTFDPVAAPGQAIFDDFNLPTP